MILVVKDYGVKLLFRKGMIVISKNKNVLERVPLSSVEQIYVLTGSVLLTSKLIRACLRSFVDIVFIDHRGEPLGRVFPCVLGGTVVNRRAQYESFYDRRGVVIAKSVIYGKISNQASVLKYFARSRRRYDEMTSRELEGVAYEMDVIRDEVRRVDGKCVDDVRQDLLTIEAKAARKYWSAVAVIIHHDYRFNGRDPEGADVVNMSLNYGYGVLRSVVWRAVLLHGLDPYAGYVHVDRSGRPSLVLDVMEVFRPVIVDRAIVSMFTASRPAIDEILDDGRLSSEFRSLILRRVLERLGESKMVGKTYHLIENVVYREVKKIVRYLRGNEETYEPYVEHI